MTLHFCLGMDLNDADIIMLDSTPEKLHESDCNPDVLIKVLYDIVKKILKKKYLKDIEDINPIPVTIIHSVTEKSVHNP